MFCLNTLQINLAPKFAETFKASSVIISCEEAVPFQIDGEYKGELNKVKISILNKAIQLFCSRIGYVVFFTFD
jgi:diacylglycerol kinase family enzyme